MIFVGQEYRRHVLALILQELLLKSTPACHTNTRKVSLIETLEYRRSALGHGIGSDQRC